MEFGDITILKNICFSDGVVDHSYRQGRPCIYIDSEHNAKDKAYYKHK